MQIHDINDFYRPRRFPWLLVVILVIVFICAITYLNIKNRPPKTISEPQAEEQTVSAADMPEEAQTQQANIRINDTNPLQKNYEASSAEVAASVVTLSAAEVNKILSEARALEAEDKLELARDKYLALLESKGASDAIKKQIETNTAKLNMALITTPRPMNGKTEYIIKSGDSLSAIAAKFNCPAALIQKSNNIADATKIRPGNRLMILDNPKFLLEVSKSANTLTVFLNGSFFKKYVVGTGMHSKTPAGIFEIYDKIEKPTWFPEGRPSIPFGDPENILGTHWLALQSAGIDNTPNVRGYGIHGTWDNTSLGKQSSAGCIRMNNSDVEELYTMLPRKTIVKIAE